MAVDPTVLAIITAAGPTLVGLGAFVTAVKNGKHLKGPNGMKSGEMIYSIYKRTEGIDTKLDTHIQDPTAHCRETSDE